jgi:protochlorophyllide reductase
MGSATTTASSTVIGSDARVFQLFARKSRSARARITTLSSSSSSSSSSKTKGDDKKDILTTKRELLAMSAAAAAAISFASVQARAEEEEEGVIFTNEQKVEEPVTVMRDIRTVLITGCNHGIGLDAAKKFAKRNDLKVILACRTLAKAKGAKSEILEAIAQEGGKVNDSSLLVPAECDLADLESIKIFATSLGDEPIDILCLNAGVQYAGSKEVNRTKDGFEISMGTDHLGHFYLTNLLLKNVESAGITSTLKPRIVVTASEVHDPESPGGKVGRGAGLGDFEGIKEDGAEFELMDGSEFDADKAYKDSKLANILFANELNRRLRLAGSQINVVSFGPGLITRSNFFQHQNQVFTKVFDFAANDLLHVAETVSGGGDCLIKMALDPELENKTGVYYNNDLGGETGHVFHESKTSRESMNVEEAVELWTWSEALVGEEFDVYV